MYLVVGSCLLLLAGCSFKSTPETIDAAEPLPSVAIIASEWHPGNAFIVDREQRLLLTSLKAAGDKADVDIDLIFPPLEDGKLVVNRDKLKQATRIKAKTLYPDAGLRDPDLPRDLALIQAESLPDGVPELKLAAEGAEKEASVELLTPGAKSHLAWARTATTVKNVGKQQFTYPEDKNKVISAQLLELNLDARLAREMSGGPVVNKNNEVVGVVASDPAQNTNLMAVDVSEVRRALAGAYRNLAVRAFEKGEYDTAIAQCDRALKMSPGDALTYNERGAAWSFKDQFARAVEDYTQAIKLDPSLALAYRNRASANIQLGKYQEAVDDCTEALKIRNNRYPMAFYTRSEAYAKMNRPKEAAADQKLLAQISQPTYQAVKVSGDLNYTVTQPQAYSQPAPMYPATLPSAPVIRRC